MKKKNIITGTVIGSFSAVVMTVVINKIIFFYSTMKKMLVSEESFFYEWRFGNIHYIKKGQGKPVVLLHDLNPVSSVYEWKNMTDRLAENHTVYALDLLGCGHSDKPRMTYTNYLYVQMLNDFIREVIKGKTDVITSASSCAIALMACHVEPSLYHKLMMINPEAPGSLAKVPKFYHKLYKYMIEIPVTGTLIYNIRTAFLSIRRTFVRKYYHQASLVRKDDIRAYHEAAHTGGSSSKYLHASIYSRYTNIPVYQAVKNSNLSMVIAGGEYVRDIEETMKIYTDLNPSIETVMIKGANYMPQLEMPDQMAEIIDIYL